MGTYLTLLSVLAAQVPPSGTFSVAEEMKAAGPYGVIVVLMFVVRYLYGQLTDERNARMADRDKYDAEKQVLNNRILDTSERSTTAVLQNTQVQRDLVQALNNEESDS